MQARAIQGLGRGGGYFERTDEKSPRRKEDVLSLLERFRGSRWLKHGLHRLDLLSFHRLFSRLGLEAM